jgi:hypothetical protein
MALKHYANFMKNKKGWNIKVYGVHIVMNYYKNINYKPYKDWLTKMGLKVKFIESNVGEIVIGSSLSENTCRPREPSYRAFCDSLCAEMKSLRDLSCLQSMLIRSSQCHERLLR